MGRGPVSGVLVVREGRVGDVEAMGWASSKEQRDVWRGLLDRSFDDQACFIVAELDGRVVGKAVLDWVRNVDGTPWLWMFSVDPEFRSQGIGTRMLEFAEARARDRGQTAIEMCVDDDNPRARDFYLRNGYAAVGSYLDEYDKPVEDGTTVRVATPGVLLRKELGLTAQPAPQPEGQRLRDDLARYYDQDAADRAARPLSGEGVRRRHEFVKALLAAGLTRVLDVGLGPGVDAIALGEAGLSVSGVDLSTEHVRLARAVGIDAQVGAAQNLPFADASFDAIWCVSVLMHMPDADLHEALREFTRVVRPGGLAAFGMWGGDGTAGINPEDTLDPPRYFNWRTDQAMRDAISEHATILQFDTWTATGRGDLTFTYQWCVARL